MAGRAAALWARARTPLAIGSMAGGVGVPGAWWGGWALWLARRRNSMMADDPELATSLPSPTPAAWVASLPGWMRLLAVWLPCVLVMVGVTVGVVVVAGMVRRHPSEAHRPGPVPEPVADAVAEPEPDDDGYAAWDVEGPDGTPLDTHDTETRDETPSPRPPRRPRPTREPREPED